MPLILILLLAMIATVRQTPGFAGAICGAAFFNKAISPKHLEKLSCIGRAPKGSLELIRR